jgi:hypothetical protein
MVYGFRDMGGSEERTVRTGGIIFGPVETDIELTTL